MAVLCQIIHRMDRLDKKILAVLQANARASTADLARQLGATAVTREGAVEAALAFSRGRGCDAVLICADTPSDDPVELAGAMARDRAQVVAVGAGRSFRSRTSAPQTAMNLGSRAVPLPSRATISRSLNQAPIASTRAENCPSIQSRTMTRPDMPERVQA